MLYRIELHRPEVDDGIRTRNHLSKRSIRGLRTGHTPAAEPPEIKAGGGVIQEKEAVAADAPGGAGKNMKLWVSRVHFGGTDDGAQPLSYTGLKCR
ncbi:hypothetical protein [Streptomyces kanamyceticus]|uniref:hypothetical protein n=1 Tax=Streptomyces kanamyceticus TaxID=1967 RepID=UPI00123CFB67|nr:hypothetical protein [Streptomyces kanamyceticus]